MIAKIIICLVLPLLFFSIILKKEDRTIAIFLSLGTIVCYLAYLLNNWIFVNTNCTYFYLTSTIAPIIEELLKFIPIFLLSFFDKNNEETVFPAAFALGIGFAITENMYMLVENVESVNFGWIILRSISTGLMHSMSASMIALGVSKAKQYPELYFVGIIASMFLAMIYHGFYNCLVNNVGIMRYIGVVMPIITYVVIFIIYKKDILKSLLMK